MRNVKMIYLLRFSIAVVIGLGVSVDANAQAKKAKAAFSNEESTQQPLYSQYKGVRLGMTAEEARAKLGTPTLKDNDQDYYMFSENESAQIVYDASHKVVTISVDYTGGIGAPDPKTVVVGELEQSPNGSMYRVMRYESLGFWVSYNRATGTVPTVTITIQKLQ